MCSKGNTIYSYEFMSRITYINMVRERRSLITDESTENENHNNTKKQRKIRATI